MRRRRTRRSTPGYLVTDAHGDVRWNDEVAVGRYGSQRGQLIPVGELDEPARRDLEQRRRADTLMSGRRTGKPVQTFVMFDEDGNPI